VTWRARFGIGSAVRALTIGIALAASCGKSDEKAPAPKPAEPAAPASGSASTSSAPKPKGPRGPIDPAKTGTITGVVAFEGTIPRAQDALDELRGCPAHESPLLSEDVIVANGKLANAFVHIKDGLSDGNCLPSPRIPSR
jgi:hypothetical protein